jgi:hypothetical protein
MSNSFLNWTSRAAIDGRIAEHRRPRDASELTTPGDYHLPFAKGRRRDKSRQMALAGLYHLKDRPRSRWGSAVSFQILHRVNGVSSRALRYGSGTNSAGKFFMSGGSAT